MLGAACTERVSCRLFSLLDRATFPTEHGYVQVTTRLFRRPEQPQVVLDLGRGNARSRDRRDRDENHIDEDENGDPPPPYPRPGRGRDPSPRRPTNLSTEAGSRQPSLARPASLARGPAFTPTQNRAPTPGPAVAQRAISASSQQQQNLANNRLQGTVRPISDREWRSLGLAPPVRVGRATATQSQAGAGSQQRSSSASSANGAGFNPQTAMVLYRPDFSRPIPQAGRGAPSGRPAHSRSASSGPPGSDGRPLASDSSHSLATSALVTHPDAQARAALAADAAARRAAALRTRGIRTRRL